VTPEARKLAVKTLRRYLRSDGALVFVMEQFFADLPATTPAQDRQPDEWQRDMLLAFGAVDAAGKAKFRRMLAIACKGPGKTALLAWLGLYFLATRPHCKVPCISITGGNLKDGLWAEFAKWMKRSKFLSAAFTWYAERVVNNEHPETWWISKRSWSPDADPTQQSTDIAGLHEDYLLWLIDECSDMPDGVVDAALAALSGGIETRVVMMGNPTRTEGPMWRACGVEAERWHVTRITGDPDDPKRSPRISLEEARATIALRGRDDYAVRVNILGLFPDRQADKLLDQRDVEAAQERELEQAAYYREPKVLGCDVARFGGDASVIFPRQGKACFRAKDFRGLDTVEFADQIITFATNWQADGGFVDGTGVGGGVVDNLKAKGFAYLAHEVNNASRALDAEHFENKRAETYWLAAEWVKKGGALPKDPMLAAELAAPRYWYTKNRVCVESKDDIKARLGRSPDRADAFVLTFAGTIMPRSRYVGVGPARELVTGVVSQHVTDH
jgi:hypothetical protein